MKRIALLITLAASALVTTSWRHRHEGGRGTKGEAVNLKPRIALFRGSGVVSWLIKTQTRSEYSHVAFVLPNTLDRVIEAREFAGVQTRVLTEHDMRSVDYYGGHRLLNRIPSAEVPPAWLSYSPKTKLVAP